MTNQSERRPAETRFWKQGRQNELRTTAPPAALRNAAPEEYQTALAGLDFPTAKDAILRKARDRGGIDREVPYVLSHLPDRTYESMSDLETEIEHVYAIGGGLPPHGPAHH